MAHYIDADRLRAEIEQLLEFDGTVKTDYYIGKRDAELVILSFLDSLQQEQPVVDFETEYAKFSNDPDALDYTFPIDLADYKDFARHFYELGLNARKEDK